MSKTKILGIALIVIVLAIAIGLALEHYGGPMTATSQGLGLLLDDLPLVDGDSIAWGTISQGEINSKNLSVTNAYETAYTIALYITGLPTDWTITWDANATELAAGESVWGWLNLTATTLDTMSGTWEILYT